MKVYFEAGANDGVFQSRTLKYKDDPEWEGFLVEPDPRCLDALLDNRSGDRAYIFDKALVSLEYDHKLGEHTDPNGNIVPAGEKGIILYQHHHSAMNFTAREGPTESARGETGQPICVYAATITEIVTEAGFDIIDELYLDVEGNELEALKGIDPAQVTVKWAEIELHRHDRPDAVEERDNIIVFMSSIGMFLAETNTAEGHPKLIFKHHLYFEEVLPI